LCCQVFFFFYFEDIETDLLKKGFAGVDNSVGAGTPGLLEWSAHGVSTFSPRHLKRMMTYDDHTNFSGSEFKKLKETLLTAGNGDGPVEKRKISVSFFQLKNPRKRAANCI
jgi:phage-related minor tail protein